MKKPGAAPARLVAVLLLACALRAVNLGGRTLWYDEAFAVLYAEKGLSAMIEGTLAQEDGAAADVHPLLYYTALNIWMGLTGQSPDAVRALSVLTGVLTLAVVYRLASDLFDRRVGLAAGLIAALSPFHIQYSQEARMYALMALWLALATWCFVKGWIGGARHPLMRGQAAVPLPGQWGWWAGFAVFAALSMYTQQLSALYLVALALFPVALRRWDVFARVVAAGIGAVVLYLPWLVNAPAQLGKIQQAYWVARPGLAQAVQTLFSFTIPLLDLPRGIIVGGLLASLVLIAFLALHGWRARRRPQALFLKRSGTLRRAGWRLGLALWLAFIPPALMFAAGQFMPVYLLRALLACALMFYVGTAWLFLRGGMPRMVAGALAALWVVVSGEGLLEHYRWNTFPNAPFDRAAAHLAEHRQPDDAIVHSNKLTFLPMRYYDRDLPQTYIADPPDAPQDTLAAATQRVLGIEEAACVQEATAGAARVWFVIFRREIQESGDPARTALGWMLAHYAPAQPISFNDLDVYRFAGPDDAAQKGACPP